MSRDIMSQDIYCPGTICRRDNMSPLADMILRGLYVPGDILSRFRGDISSRCFSGATLATFANCWSTFCNFLQLLAIFGGFWLLLATFGNKWELVAIYGNFLKQIVTFGNKWELLASNGNFWQHMAAFGYFWHQMGMSNQY